MTGLANAWPKAFGGGPLVGDKIVKFVYVDEAGISENEPVTIVAGVLIDGDRQFRVLSSYIQGLVEAFVPEDKRKGFAFHAKELANGGKTFVRGEYPDEKRLHALRKMASIPRRFLLPIVIGWERKEAVPPEMRAKRTARQRQVDSHVMAHMQCVIGADQLMRRFTKPDEVAICVAENNDEAKRAIKGVHRFIYETPGEQIDFLSGELPIQRIIDTVHFAEKDEAVLLQIADTVAYVAKRFINGAQGADLLMELMLGSPLSREIFDSPAGYQIIIPQIADKVVNQQAWYASKLARSNDPVEGLKSARDAGIRGFIRG